MRGKIISIGLEHGVRDHVSAFFLMLKDLGPHIKDIKLIAHRVVHGGLITQPLILNKKNIKQLDLLDDIAPLHNPFQTQIIKLCLDKINNAINVALFDTSFHTTKPDYASFYPIPIKIQKKLNIRRYGFHGLSHNYLLMRAKQILSKPKLNLITLHIGNGISFSVIKNNKSIDNTMGYSPLEGPMMGTRSGNIDPEVVLALVSKYGVERVSEILNKESGLKGISGISSDIRILIKHMGKKEVKLAFDMFVYSLRKTLGSCLTLIKPDAIIVSGGIGENSPYIRKRLFEGLEHMNIKIDNKRNNFDFSKIKQDYRLISYNRVSGKKSDNKSLSFIPIYVIKTDEELFMAKIAYRLLRKVL